jgi:hypothetical protein
LKSTVGGVLQVKAINADGTQQDLPELYIQRWQEIDYPPLKNMALELNQQKGQEELLLTLIPETYDPNIISDKNILEGVITEESTSQASYLINHVHMPIIKRIVLIHR